MITLPYDIWVLITEYLPLSQVQELYSVNRHLFDIALDLLYKKACIPTRGGHEDYDIKLFSNPLLAPRAKTLRMNLSFSACPYSKRKMRMKSRLSERKADVKPIRTVALNILPKLTSVHTLAIDHVGNSVPYGRVCTSDRLFPDIWKPLQNRLTALDLFSLLEDLPLILPTSRLLTCLETFSIKFRVFYRTTDPIAIIDQNLVPFLLAHQSTIRNLTFDVDNTEFYLLNISTILQRLETIACIHRLNIKSHIVDMRNTDFSGHHAFLKAQRDHLKSLTVKFIYLDSFRYCSDLYTQPWCSVTYPNLAELRVEGAPARVNGDWLDWVERLAGSLVSLDVKLTSFCSFANIVSMSPRLGKLTLLRHLKISIFSMSPDMLVLLARDIHDLRYLGLSSHSIEPLGKALIEDDSDGPSFADVMQVHAEVFAKWRLRHLDYTFAVTPQDLQIIRKALVDFLPNVQQFCGMDKDEYLQFPCRNNRDITWTDIRTNPSA